MATKCNFGIPNALFHHFCQTNLYSGYVPPCAVCLVLTLSLNFMHACMFCQCVHVSAVA